MTDPLVSIGMPVYRGADIVGTTLACVLGQTYTNLDVLVSIDGADEESLRACEPYLKDPRVRLQMQPERLGWAGNFDWTIRNSRGEVLIFQQHYYQVSPA